MKEVEFDQHFLIDESILDKTIEVASITSDDVILEIGPGKGVLSERILVKNPEKLIAVEIDERMKDSLQKIEEEHFHFHVIYKNALEMIDELYYTKLIANIPYSITEPLYKKLMERKAYFVMLLHGKAFYDQIISDQSKWSYFVPAFYDIELLKEVPGTCFEPRAKVDSVLVKLEVKEELSKEDEFFQTLFSKKDRNAKNAVVFSLVDVLEIPKKEAKEIVESIGLSSKCSEVKLENISNEEFMLIVKKIKETL